MNESAAPPGRWMTALPLLALLLATAIVVAIRYGAVGFDAWDVVRALGGRGEPTTVAIVQGLRAPRVIEAALVGAALALAGTCYQALLRNALADPYILGIAGGASVGSVLAIVTGVAVAGVWTLPLAGFVGAIVALLIVLRVAVVGNGVVDPRTMLLAGVIVGAFTNAVVLLALALSDDAEFRGAMLWLMGSLAGATWERVLLLALITVVAVVALVPQARALNLLAIGELTAQVLGTRVERTKWIVLGAASLLTASAVAVSGTIGFVGLVIPNALRLVWGSDHRLLLPTSMLAGASFLVLADLLARSAIAPRELPLGVITALIGVPVFVVLLRRRRDR